MNFKWALMMVAMVMLQGNYRIHIKFIIPVENKKIKCFLSCDRVWGFW